jgi:hypothetical protein
MWPGAAPSVAEGARFRANFHLTRIETNTNMNSGSYMKRALLCGLLLWIVGTLGLRFAGPNILHPGRSLSAVILYAVSFALMAILIPRIPRSLKLDKDTRFAAISLLILPTLLLDPFSCLFFPAVFPNIAPAAAGLFGGWMLICCAGAVVGAWLQR